MKTTPPLDERMMARAIELSRKGFPAPNPRVGCVIARGSTVAGQGYHAFAGGPHAEIVALRDAGERARGATAFVTLEPCRHVGKTPPCVDALLEAGIVRVVVACLDPTPIAGGGLARLAEAGVETESGLLADAARAVNGPWLAAAERRSPFVVIKAAMTLDGRLATPRGESKWITGEAARAEAHRLRAECGAVVVGRGTVEKDNPRLTVRALEVANQPTRIVLDPWRRVAAGTHVFDSEAPSIRVVAGEPRSGEMRVAHRAGYLDLPQLMTSLWERGITAVLVEGGAHTIGSFIDADLVDRLELFVSGKVFGEGKSWVERPFPGAVSSAFNLRIEGSRMLGDDLWITGVPTKVPPRPDS